MAHKSLSVQKLALATISAFAFSTNPGAAHGAIAVGEPSDVARYGYALGIAVNQESENTARLEALRLCRNDETAGDSPGKSICRVVQAFQHQCAVEANDPKEGTPGWGWAVADEQRTAEKQALDQCIQRSKQERRSACKVLRAACDTIP